LLVAPASMNAATTAAVAMDVDLCMAGNATSFGARSCQFPAKTLGESSAPG